MGKSHKNKNDAKGNFIIYKIFLNRILFKFGKADAERVTKSSGLPTRLHQQVRKFGKNGFQVVFQIIAFLFNITTKEAKKKEDEAIEAHKKENGSVPEGNKKHKKK